MSVIVQIVSVFDTIKWNIDGVGKPLYSVTDDDVIPQLAGSTPLTADTSNLVSLQRIEETGFQLLVGSPVGLCTYLSDYWSLHRSVSLCTYLSV